MNFIDLDSVASTNAYAGENAANLPSMTFITTQNQTAGRGQRGNKWESEPSKNLTFSLLWKPEEFKVTDQFAISKATAIAVTEMLASYGIESKIKWPNDIYVGDKKICGILIEHAVGSKHIIHSIIGAGININQEKFVSDAPNPVSMLNVAGKEYDLQEVTKRTADTLEKYLEVIVDDTEALNTLFLSKLWRRDGKFHIFRDTGDGVEFEAMILDTEHDGRLRLIDRSGTLRRYYFKEVEHII